MRREGQARGAGKDSGGATQTREINGRGSTREKRTKKLNTDISARRGAEAVGRQALAERAASEAKFVLIAERKTQEEA